MMHSQTENIITDEIDIPEPVRKKHRSANRSHKFLEKKKEVYEFDSPQTKSKRNSLKLSTDESFLIKQFRNNREDFSSKKSVINMDIYSQDIPWEILESNLNLLDNTSSLQEERKPPSSGSLLIKVKSPTKREKYSSVRVKQQASSIPLKSDQNPLFSKSPGSEFPHTDTVGRLSRTRSLPKNEKLEPFVKHPKSTPKLRTHYLGQNQPNPSLKSKSYVSLKNRRASQDSSAFSRRKINTSETALLNSGELHRPNSPVENEVNILLIPYE